MGIYQKIGIRNLAINTDRLINWVRQYGLRDGLKINMGLQKHSNHLISIRTNIFRHPIYIRDNYSDKAIFSQVFYEKQYFLEKLKTINAEFIIDAGANIGLSAIYFLQQYPLAHIIAIEPQLDNYALLKKNLEYYKNATCLNAALWNKEENIEIKNPDSLAASFMVEAKANAALRAITIHNLLDRYKWGSVDILKIDIEGAEKNVFSGDTSWLKQVKVLIVELHDNYENDCTKTFFKAIESYQYEAYFSHENVFIFFKQA